MIPLSPRFAERLHWMETESRYAEACPDLDQEFPVTEKVYEPGALSYEPETGLFWQNGHIAGTMHIQGYVEISWKGQKYLAHRLAWFFMTGEWPPYEIDHINRDRNDTRWANLRLASRAENMCNQGLRQNNTSGYRGVAWHAQRGKWRAYLTVGGKQKHLGLFDTAEEANLAAKAARYVAYGEFA